MLKIRLMGMENDIKWFKKVLQKTPQIEIMEFSNLFSNKGTKQYYRSYVEVRKRSKKEEW